MRRGIRAIISGSLLFTSVIVCAARETVSVSARDLPATEVFRMLMDQTGMNFVYPYELLQGIRVTVTASDRPLSEVLGEMFAGTDIEYRIKGDNVMLKRSRKHHIQPVTRPVKPQDKILTARLLDEVIVTSRLESPEIETAEIGTRKLTAGEILAVPVIFGEPDVIKALHSEPGVTTGQEGMAGMYVHGGNADENLYMLDNVPLYQVNHFAGLFSAFNPDAVRYVDFFKSSFPAKYDGRLSSFLDVRTQNGRVDGHHGSVRLGLTSGAVNVGGPIGESTTYNFALRRSWYDVLTVPMMALINAASDDEKIRFRYAFTDFNAKVRHRFNKHTSAYVSLYFGDDQIHTGDKSGENYESGFFYNDKYDFSWGNLVAQTGLIKRHNDELSAEYTLAYTRYFSNLKKDEREIEKHKGEVLTSVRTRMKTDNHINDWIARADYDWRPGEGDQRIRFGGGYTLHSFLPSRTTRLTSIKDADIEVRDSAWNYLASEFNAYIEDDWRISELWRINAGLHLSSFIIDRHASFGVSPRMSVSYRPGKQWAVKGSYSRTVQYVHQLSQTYLSLPTDQWIPITGGFRPETADKVSAGVYWQSLSSEWTISAEGWWKKMHNLVDYSDEYYLKPPMEFWNDRLVSGDGSARGIDLKIERTSGPLTGQLVYSLGWSDRTFAEKNGGKTFPSRFDNRHTINLLIGWRVNNRVTLNASWIGRSGNRYTLMTQTWQSPDFGINNSDDEVPLRVNLNNYRLPFYHRLDLSCMVRNSRGYWTFGLYNAYCHLNTVAVTRGFRTYTKFSSDSFESISRPAFQKLRLLPLIPSISYTWQF